MSDSVNPSNIGKSIFAKMQNLATLYTYNNYGIEDYLPIAQREGTEEEAELYLSNLANLFIYNGGTNEITYEDSYNRLEAVQLWWAARNGTGTSSTLRLVRASSLTENTSGSNQISNAVNAMTALAKVSQTLVADTVNYTLTDFLQGDNLINGSLVSYSIQWATAGAAANVLTLENKTITSYTSETQKTNHKIPMKAYVEILSGTTPHYIGRIVYITIRLNTSDALKVELSAAEKTRYESMGKTVAAENSRYFIAASDAIPDGSLLNRLFFVFDTITVDNIIDIEERYSVSDTSKTTLELNARGISDITGLELFPNATKWNLYDNQLTVIPNLAIYASSKIVNIQIYSNKFLYDLSGLIYDYDGEGTEYTSLAKIITTLSLYNCFSVNDTQIQYLSGLTMVTSLSLRATNIVSFGFILNYTTVTTLDIRDNNYVYTDGNQEIIRKFYLHRNATGSVYGTDTKIFADYLNLQPVYNIGTRYELPAGFTMYGEDYTLIWDDITGGIYTYEYTGGKYYVTPLEGAGESIQLTARAVYNSKNTYLETITLKTSTPYTASLYEAFEGEIQLENNGAYYNLADYVPDMSLRYYMLRYFDTETADKKLSYSELGAAVPLDITGTSNRQIICGLQGIQYLRNITELHLRYINTYDYSYLSTLTQLTKLTISYSYVPLSDFTFMQGLSSLSSFTLTNTVYTNLNFVMDSLSLVSLYNINAANTSENALYVKNAWAYSRTVNNLEENAANMAGDLAAHTSEADQKVASLILDGINLSLAEPGQKTSVHLNYNTVYENLPSSVTYKDAPPYDIEWVSLSDVISVSGTTITTGADTYKKESGLIARITYNGASYERYYFITLS